MQPIRRTYVINICVAVIALGIAFNTGAQCNNSTCIWDKLIAVENNTAYTPAIKYKEVLALKSQFEAANLKHDSVYARIFHRLGALRYGMDNLIAGNEAINNTLLAVRINMSGVKGSCKSFAAKSYYNLGLLYESLHLYEKALRYLDSSIQVASQFPGPGNIGLTARTKLVELLVYQEADYQKAEEESSQGIIEATRAGDDATVLGFYNLRASALLFQGHLQQAAKDADSALAWADQNNYDQLASAFKTRAQVFGKLGDGEKAIKYFIHAIKQRKSTGAPEKVADDYVDFGNYYINVGHDYNKAKECYFNALNYAKQSGNFERIAIAEADLDVLYFGRKDYQQCMQHNLQAQNYLLHTANTDNLINPPAEKLKTIGNKELLYTIFSNKTETLIYLFTKTKNSQYLDAALQTAKLTDTLLTMMRNAQTGEQSKLYWRDHAKVFYGYALEAAYLENNTTLAFYFMEKSRSVLLGDALNELGASAQLPAAEFAEQERLQVNVIEQQQKLSALEYNSPGYAQQEIILLQAKDALEHYTRMLETKRPAYSRYKYADNIPSLDDVQKYLKQNSQSFIHYFAADSAVYILVTSVNQTKFIRLSADEFTKNDIVAFEQFCADGSRLNSGYPAFSKLSNRLYKQLFEKLQLPPGRVIICTDDFLIPFEALCTDTTGKNFLINNYTFSYVYSAGYLLRKFNTSKADGNFFGIAPVSFPAKSRLVKLTGSDNALRQSSGYYGNSSLFIGGDATRRNFFSSAPSYSVVTVFSHASADSGNNEPVMYMGDSSIYLSELSFFTNPATQLVILSACETNAGKKAAGEGIYSLARGFSAAGIPAVAATLWKADDEAIYTITDSFNHYLAAGIPKDEALRKAKIAYMQSSREHLLPYYWANLVIVGNVQPLQLVPAGSPYKWLIITCIVIVAIAAIFFVFRAANKKRKAIALLVMHSETL